MALTNSTSFNCLPGGMLMPGRGYSGSSASYKFGYQGSIKDDEISGIGNDYSTFFRELDVRTLRWWGVDPKTSATPWESPYMIMGGNPIWLTDILGDKWDRDKDKQTAAKMDVEATTKIGEYQSKIDELKKQDGTGDQINDYESRTKELQSSIQERASMGSEDDPTRYRFNNWNKGYGETFKKDTKQGTLVVMNYGDWGDAFHEQKHGFQIKMGELGGNGADDPLYDVGDEVAAKKREYSYVNRNTPLMSKGYKGITEQRFVERVVESYNNPNTRNAVSSYIKIVNDYLMKNGSEPLK